MVQAGWILALGKELCKVELRQQRSGFAVDLLFFFLLLVVLWMLLVLLLLLLLVRTADDALDDAGEHLFGLAEKLVVGIARLVEVVQVADEHREVLDQLRVHCRVLPVPGRLGRVGDEALRQDSRGG